MFDEALGPFGGRQRRERQGGEQAEIGEPPELKHVLRAFEHETTGLGIDQHHGITCCQNSIDFREHLGRIRTNHAALEVRVRGGGYPHQSAVRVVLG